MSAGEATRPETWLASAWAQLAHARQPAQVAILGDADARWLRAEGDPALLLRCAHDLLSLIAEQTDAVSDEGQAVALALQALEAAMSPDEE